MQSISKKTPKPNNKGAQAQLLGMSGVLAMSLLVTGCGSNNAETAQDASSADGSSKNVSLLNVSYDVSRDFYKDYNELFSENYQKENPGSKVNIKQSHGGSSKQALSVANGLQADVVTFNQESDMNLLVEKGLVATDWKQALPNNAVPYTSTMVLLVRNGNPKNIKDWSDLARSDIKVVMPNPKTSGTARYAFLGAYGYGLHQFKESPETHVKTDGFIKDMLANVVTYDNGARAATTSFTQRGLGDVLITTENEAHLAAKDFAKGQVDIVYPSYSVLINNPVAVVTAVTDKAGKTDAANTYLKGLWETPAQELMAQMYMRPSDEQILAEHKDTLPAITTFEPVSVLGPWEQIMDTFFVDGGRFDQLAQVK
ncbi:sulfate ABC transporter substrate-binding protein [Psychrobacter sp. JB385]|uniref:sulfate ABC transporter substrate-binding protein n=1 Tax=Psychrobacter sp. JB385 TaxID=1434841 RepID=UPI00097EC2E6|nr:sulfate ABC transporter substrate-binding protein [Psychrobacter sp. JB385]SJN26839.1 Sulfate and thiosulfate binding protein CysP [Psychrobacter sp. JB385]